MLAMDSKDAVTSRFRLALEKDPGGGGAWLRIEAPCRLHFGLWTLSSLSPRRYGGVGVMVEPPCLHLHVEEADRFAVVGFFRQRLERTARQWATFHQSDLPRCRLNLVSSPPLHVGLGIGTQLALSVAAALHAVRSEPLPEAEVLARSTGRGRRSAVGVYGFLYGGMIVESGKADSQWLSPLEAQVNLPETWRFVLIRPTTMQGLCGAREDCALAKVADLPVSYSEQLAYEARHRLVPAARAGDFQAFSQSVRRYGELAGDWFSAVQGGRYRGAILQQLVEWLHEMGVEGVGQSSWGPTLYAVVEDEMAARSLGQALRESFPSLDLDITVAAVAHGGAKLAFTGSTPHRSDHTEKS